jgi:hypothetical protein
MPIKFKCPHCQTPLSAGSDLAGKAAKCPDCGKDVTVPGEKGAQTVDGQDKREKKE